MKLRFKEFSHNICHLLNIEEASVAHVLRCERILQHFFWFLLHLSCKKNLNNFHIFIPECTNLSSSSVFSPFSFNSVDIFYGFVDGYLCAACSSHQHTLYFHWKTNPSQTFSMNPIRSLFTAHWQMVAYKYFSSQHSNLFMVSSVAFANIWWNYYFIIVFFFKKSDCKKKKSIKKINSIYINIKTAAVKGMMHQQWSNNVHRFSSKFHTICPLWVCACVYVCVTNCQYAVNFDLTKIWCIFIYWNALCFSFWLHVFFVCLCLF